MLERYLPTGRNDVHTYHFGCQQADEAAYLIAWSEEAAVGHVVVTWAGFREEPARLAVPQCPAIGYLQVTPASRGKGVGSALVGAAEACIAARGFRRAGLAVGIDNPAAARLYQRLGYQDTSVRCESQYTWYDDAGVGHDVTEMNLYLAKDLSGLIDP
ncbi:GNAT family N-acetyltransferase [Actinospica durhamensis]|uniref:GNAT family N-acetyltransferase n=1 Tax=Actinospica durhamensis TaxID=1508375 RepID=A0A941EWE7_9ACTN|nr:GNAT family N-acetyltransferase [Actinospica durhamensis]MBR7838501.1 GNAT family N-acetyltransferase [Actinospica durhamensis]